MVYALALQHGVFSRAPQPTAAARGTQNCNEDALASAYRNRQSRVEVCGRGVVVKVLKEDPEGARHQRFIVRLPSAQTVLVAYNLELAPRIEGLRPGAPIEFAGEYEWNRQGGVVHWTHRDPAGHHPPGWIRYDGHLYP